MKKIMFGALCALLTLASVVGCKKEDKKTSDPTPSNTAPSATVTFPTKDWVEFADNDSTIVFTATASDVDGSIAKVEFYVDNVKLGEDITSPYSYNYLMVTNVPHIFKVIATDDKGLSTTSTSISAVLYHN